MSEVGLSKLEQPDFTASTRAGSPALLVISEQTIPPLIGCPSHLSSIAKGFSAELKRGAAIPGASSAIPNRYSW